MKCPRCNEEMMTLCRRDSDGFLNEMYYRCLSCGFVPKGRIPRDHSNTAVRQPKTHTLSKARNGSWPWKVLTATMLASLVLISVMQIPVPTRVFAAQTSLDPVKSILPYVNLVNLTFSQFTLNYTMEQTTLRVSSDFASLTSTETGINETTSVIVLGKVLVNYQDAQRTFNLGFASMTVTVRIRWQALIANIDATAYMPLWTAILDNLTGQLP